MATIKILSHQDLQQIHAESLKILSEIGIRVPNQMLLDIFKKKGARVDFSKEIVKIPAKLVNRVIGQAVDRQSTYYSRNSNASTRLTPLRGWMSEANLSSVFDYSTNSARKATLREMLYGIVLGNSLENIERVSCLVIDEDFGKHAPIINYYLLNLFSEKRYFIGAIDTLNSAKCIIQMARVIAEDETQLRNGRLAEFELEAANNLEFSKTHLDIAFEFAKNRMKILPGGWFWMGYHSPMTFASAISLSNANILAAMVVTMLINPETIFFDYLFGTQSVGEKDDSSPLFGSPNQAIFSIVGRQLADFYGFKKCITNTGLSDSVQNDFQSGFERGVTAALAIAAGVNQIGLQGIVGADQGISFEELIIDDEMISYLNYIFQKDIEINEHTLKFDSIKKNGPGKRFPVLGSATSDTIWRSRVFSSGSYSRKKNEQLFSRANLEFQNTIKRKFPPAPVVDKEQERELNNILGKFIDRRIVSLLQSKLGESLNQPGSEGISL